MIEFHCQDVTPVNADYLQYHADRLHVGDIAAIDGEFDVIFSTYVLEHVCDPERFLGHVDRLLAPNGWRFVFRPRYDSAFYVCPSLRHQPLVVQIAANVRLACDRTSGYFSRCPRFRIKCDPAVLHGPWRRDADAVHVVNRRAADILQERHAGWHVPHGDVAAAVAAVKQAASLPQDARQAMGDRASQRISRDFSRSRLIEHLVSLLCAQRSG